jgi:hypothetical protein
MPWLEASQRTFLSRHQVQAIRDRFLGGLLSFSIFGLLFLGLFWKLNEASDPDASGEGSIRRGSFSFESILTAQPLVPLN